MGITEIIRQGLAHGDSYEVINKALADAGFNLKLVPRENTGWTEQEMKEGFKEGEPGVVFPTLADMMKRNMKMAGMEEEIWCKEGKYKITWNEDGYATKAVRCNV
jgi:hypothetical protein